MVSSIGSCNSHKESPVVVIECAATNGSDQNNTRTSKNTRTILLAGALVVIAVSLLSIGVAFLVYIQHSDISRGTSRDASSNNTAERLWRPQGNRTREHWLQCHGQPSDKCDRVRTKMQQLKTAINQRIRGIEYRRTATSGPANDLQSLVGVTSSTATTQSNQTTGQSADDTFDGCVWLTEEQIDSLMNNVESVGTTKRPSNTVTTTESSKKRRKRQVQNFNVLPSSKWSMPITWKFDGTHNIYQRPIIRDAFQHWMDNTCVRFQEIDTYQPFSKNHILITSASTGCNSYIGKVSLIPQPINLQDICLRRFGSVVHEIGHGIGLWHEQTRPDRDDYIQVLWPNISPLYTAQYAKASPQYISNAANYNYGSVMHYAPQDASSWRSQNTMRALNPLYQRNMGQRTGLSFENIKAINSVYCSNVCDPSALPSGQTCQRGGYQHPNNCSRCLCPDGFGGDYCEQLARPTNYANCGGEITMVPGVQQTIRSPGYDKPGFYYSFQSCSWLIKAPQNYVIQLQFVGDFGLYCDFNACYHWIEVKYKSDLSLEGPRFCCYTLPTDKVLSESNEMMIVFKANFSRDFFVQQRGFQAVLNLVPVDTTTTTSLPTSSTTSPITTSPVTSSSEENLSPTATTATTTTTTTAMSTDLPATMEPTSTTTAAAVGGGGGSNSASDTVTQLYQCSFEDQTLCGLMQDATDQFDWTVYSLPTPSAPTGPDYAYDGYWYIYIEASSPRQPNDNARLLFPQFNYNGTACIDFYYHLYGADINTLTLVRRTSGIGDVAMWARSQDMGNIWRRATVEIGLTPDSQLLFTASRGKDYLGDIGLDMITLTTGSCPSSSR